MRANQVKVQMYLYDILWLLFWESMNTPMHSSKGKILHLFIFEDIINLLLLSQTMWTKNAMILVHHQWQDITDSPNSL